MKTKYQKLLELVNAPFKVNGIRANSQQAFALQNLLSRGWCYSTYTTGSGRFTSARHDITHDIERILTAAGVKWEKRNDAPRGGHHADKIFIISPAVLNEIKNK